jgi:hypothetical protein
MDKTKLRLGLLLDSYTLPAWANRSIELILDGGCAEISLIILRPTASSAAHQQKAGQRSGPVVFRALNAVDEKLFVRQLNALENVDCAPHCTGVPVLQAEVTQCGESGYLSAKDIEQIRGYDLDLIVTFSEPDAGMPSVEAGGAARYGIWSCTFTSAPPGFWEVVKDQPETKTGLLIISAKNHGGAYHSLTSAATYPFSPARNRNRILWLASSILPRQIDRLHRLGAEEYFRQYGLESDGGIEAQHPSSLTNLAAEWIGIKLFIRLLGELFTRFYYQDGWFLWFSSNPDQPLPSAQYTELMPPDDRFWADPMLVKKDGITYIFVEELIYKEKKGHISVITVDAQGKCGEPSRVLSEPHHLSYPCVFAWQNQYYLVPESSERHTIDLYACLEFPGKWQYKMSLMQNISAVDTTLFFYRDKWWLFTGVTEHPGSFPEVELCLYYADDLFTHNWRAHPANPIVSDVKNARPAGKIFLRDGIIYRPAQDCSKTYGYGIHINQIVTLTETDYKEVTADTILPDWDPRILATHTYGVEGNFHIVDTYARRRKFF